MHISFSFYFQLIGSFSIAIIFYFYFILSFYFYNFFCVLVLIEFTYNCYETSLAHFPTILAGQPAGRPERMLEKSRLRLTQSSFDGNGAELCNYPVTPLIFTMYCLWVFVVTICLRRIIQTNIDIYCHGRKRNDKCYGIFHLHLYALGTFNFFLILKSCLQLLGFSLSFSTFLQIRPFKRERENAYSIGPRFSKYR